MRFFFPPEWLHTYQPDRNLKIIRNFTKSEYLNELSQYFSTWWFKKKNLQSHCRLWERVYCLVWLFTICVMVGTSLSVHCRLEPYKSTEQPLSQGVTNSLENVLLVFYFSFSVNSSPFEISQICKNSGWHVSVLTYKLGC